MTVGATVGQGLFSTQDSGPSPSPFPWTLLLDDAPRPGWQNMAIDQTLLDGADRDGTFVLRLYRWSPPCFSFGRNEPALRRFDRDRIAALGVDTVRRPTGGRVVWHDGELTYAVAGPVARFGSLAEGYRRLHMVLIAALGRLGVEATLAARPAAATPLEAGACFAQTAGGEVVVKGSKVIGSAQVRQSSAFLQHGSLLLSGDQSMVTRVTRGTAPAGGCLHRPLAALLGRPVTFAEAAGPIVETARECFGMESESSHLQIERPWAVEHGERFRSEAWTWSR